MSTPAQATPIEDFLTYLREVRQLSPHTIAGYRRDLSKLQAWCETGTTAAVDELDEAAIRQWIANLHRQGLAGNSIQRALSACRAFFDFQGRQGGEARNPATGISAPRSPRRLPRTLDVDQVGQLLNGPAPDTALTLRDRAMAELLYSSGLRLAELAAIDLDDIDPGSALITVTGKGSKTRTVPVGSIAMEALRQWLTARPTTVDTSSTERALFTSRRGRRISQRNIQARLRLYGRQQGMRQDIHPHMLRHPFASHMLESSGDLRAVQELLGHANISTTQIYTHLDFQHLAKVYDAAHPRARRRGGKEPK